jgi:ATP-binding cassette subfamily F protein uup
MTHIRLNNVSLQLNDQQLFDAISFALKPGEKWILIGKNGQGKTTFLNTLNQKQPIDSGQIDFANNLRIGYLKQHHEPSHLTVWEQAISLFYPNDIHWFSEMFQTGSSTTDPSFHLSWALHCFQTMSDYWAFFSIDPMRSFAELSGGEQKKSMLCALLAGDWDCLFLDEPTNHLDIQTILWLETKLKAASCSQVVITHDRKFANRIATGYLELDKSKLYASFGQYEDCLIARDTRQKARELEQHKLGKEIEREEDWMRYGVTARRKRNQRRVAQLDNLKKTFRAYESEQRKVSGIPQAKQSGRKIIYAENLDVGYTDNLLIRHLTINIPKGAKVAICGPNGIGKSTLIQTLIGDIPPLAGTLELGTNITSATFSQKLEQIVMDQSVFDQVSLGKDEILIGNERMSIYRYLQIFGLDGSIMHRTPRSLSGGMCQRLELALTIKQDANVLIIDEPTNNLDIDSMEMLSELLVNYNGTLLLISHDRQLIEDVATHTLIINPDKSWQWHHGAHLIDTPHNIPSAQKTSEVKKNSLSKEERIELRTLTKKIDQLETLKKEIEEKLADPKIYQDSQLDKIQKFKSTLSDIEKEISAQYQRWEWLEEKNN